MFRSLRNYSQPFLFEKDDFRQGVLEEEALHNVDFLCRTDSARVTLNPEFQEYIWENPRKAQSLDLDKYTKPLIEEFNRIGKRK